MALSVDDTPTSSKGSIAQSLRGQGASESLAEAIADAAAEAGFNRREITYEKNPDSPRGHTIYVNVSGAVPDPVHDRLTDMGFVVMDKYDAHSDDGPVGCKYEDEKYQ